MARTSSNMLPLGTALPDFEGLEPRTGTTLTREDFGGTVLVVAFVCNHCPFVVHLWDALVAFAAEFAEQGVQTLAFSSNDAQAYPADSPEKMAELAQASGASFPYLYDASQEAAKAFDATCTPEFYVFDQSDTLVYRGQFDDSRPGSGQAANGADLRSALTTLLAGKPLVAEQKPSVGCSIKWK